jgi:hypothetical protein
LTLVVMASVQCLVAAEMTPAQHACCAAISHDCDGTAMRQSCCSTEAPRVDAVSAAKRVSIAVPAGAVAQVATIDVAPPYLVPSRSPRVDPLGASPPGVHTYLLNSVFRI